MLPVRGEREDVETGMIRSWTNTEPPQLTISYLRYRLCHLEDILTAEYIGYYLIRRFVPTKHSALRTSYLRQMSPQVMQVDMKN